MDLKKKKLASEKGAYLNNIVRHIKAPARIRARIRMDLLTEIEAQEEAGVPFSDFKLQRGDPIQVAATFNEAYSGTDIRKALLYRTRLSNHCHCLFCLGNCLVFC